MTVSVQTNRDEFTGNGVTTAFATTFEFQTGTDLKVYLDGVLKTITTHYTVSGGAGSTGTVTFLVAPGNGLEVVIYDDPPVTQGTDYTPNDAFPAESHELALDKLTRIARTLKSRVDRAAVLSDFDTSGADTTLPTPSSRRAIVWNTAADGFENSTYDPDEAQTASAASAAAAAASASAASTSASNAATSETNAATSEANADTARIAAETAETNAETAEANAEAAAIAQGMPFVFDTTTAMADPGAGKIRFNNAALASATAAALDDLDAESRDLSAYIPTWDDSTNTNKGTLVVTKSGGAAFAIYTITGLTDNAGWTELAVTYVTGSGAINNTDRVYLHFSRTGDKGADGAGTGDFMADGSVPMTGALVFEGSTADDFETSLSVEDPTADNAIVLPNRSGTVALTSDIGGAFKNKIIGGDFTTNPWQRGTTFTGWADNAYGADRFWNRNVSTGVVDLKKTADAPTVSAAGVFTQHCLHVDVTTADAAVAAGDRYALFHSIEGLNAASLGFGQSGTRYVTLSFWHKHTKTGTHCVALRNNAADRNYISEYTQDVSDTWEKATVTIPVDTTGTWLYDTSAGVIVVFGLMAGTTWQGSANTWQAGNLFATANQVNNLDNIANNFKLALIQLEAGSSATTFEARAYQQELALCQRYYYRIFPNVNAAQLVPSAYMFSTTVAHGTVVFPTTMRSAPTALEQSGTAADYRVLHGATTTACSAVPVFNQANVYMAKTDFTVAAGLTVGQAGNIIAAAASSAGYLGWSAEL